jgi:hypothetical protein
MEVQYSLIVWCKISGKRSHLFGFTIDAVEQYYPAGSEAQL